MWKGVLCFFVCKRHVSGVLRWSFDRSKTGCELRWVHEGFLGKFGMGPSWVMRKNVWWESLDGPQLGDLEGW